MRTAPVLLLGAFGCTVNLDHRAIDATEPNARLCPVVENEQTCLDAAQHSDFTYVATKILTPKCGESDSCHQGGSIAAGYLDFRNQGSAYTSLVNRPSQLDPTRMLVVPGSSQQSFLSVMIGQIKPSEADPPLASIPLDASNNVVGTMPQGDFILCCQKVDAIAAWIQAGAPMQ